LPTLGTATAAASTAIATAGAGADAAPGRTASQLTLVLPAKPASAAVACHNARLFTCADATAASSNAAAQSHLLLVAVQSSLTAADSTANTLCLQRCVPLLPNEQCCT
jgi:hypothetical protein